MEAEVCLSQGSQKGNLAMDSGKADHRSDHMPMGAAAQNTPVKAKNNRTTETQIIKSPSDTTLYKPALQKGRQSELINQISNFVKNIRMESERPGSSRYDETEHRHEERRDSTNGGGE